MDTVKNHFENEASEFDQTILKLIPYYPEMIDGLVSAIPHPRSKTLRIIDLGCGTGTTSKKIKALFPHAEITCLDIAENMIEMAKTKLAGYSAIRYQIDDLRHYAFDGHYDVIVSSLALHHLTTDAEKKECYNKLYRHLAADGVFLNADVVLGSSDHLQQLYMEKWTAFMKKHVPESDIENKWLPQYREEDRPAKLMDHIAWLSATGFREIDIVWKYYNFSVYCGRK